MTASPSTSHWGAFRAADHPERGLQVTPHPADPSPSPLLGNLAGSLRHATRIRRPAVRRGWLENGPGPTTSRGTEPFVEVDWDEALDLVAAELDRVRREHGNQAIFGGSYGWASAGRFHHAQSQLHRFLNQAGGYTSSRNSYSLGASLVLLPHLVGAAGAEEVLRSASTWTSLREHTELVVAFGGMPAKNVHVTPGGVTRHLTPGHLADLGDGGTEVVLVSPLRGDLPDGLEVDWLPIRPGTDTALLLALAHTLIVEELVDHDFLDRCTVGWETFEAAVEGRDADWAAPLCGLEADRIRGLARRMATARTMVSVTWSLQRAQYGEQPIQAALTLAAMLGQIGLPGGGFGHGYGSIGDVGESGSTVPLPRLEQGPNPVDTFIPCARIADLLLHPRETFAYDGATHTYPDIRLVHWAGGNPFHHHQDLNRLARAFGRPDTVVVQDPFWTASARHADVVLPVTTTLEREDLGSGRRDTHLIAMHQVVEPVGEARDDHAVLAALAERLGFEKTFTEGRSPHEWLEHLYEEWRDRLDPELPSFSDFWAAGELELPLGPESFTLFEDFRRDPEAHPLQTPSGRIELTSSTIAAMGLPDCPGHATWLEPDEWLGSSDAGGRLLLIANQPATRLHSQHDVGEVSLAAKVADREAVEIHPDTARDRGIREGDVVRLWNARGAVLAGAVLTEALRPDVVRLPTGAWFDPLPTADGVLCVHGNPNALTADVPTSRLTQGCTGQHALVDLERYDGVPPPVTVRHPPELQEAR
ncbi:putative biotin sulfoxide reductase [metagenome]|uniref:Putative biotin sulfoxide reductase n=1 Tax=metagenome TaxID=256318 RepID=A0A2P2CFP3_9ZZZZ